MHQVLSGSGFHFSFLCCKTKTIFSLSTNSVSESFIICPVSSLSSILRTFSHTKNFHLFYEPNACILLTLTLAFYRYLLAVSIQCWKWENVQIIQRITFREWNLKPWIMKTFLSSTNKHRGRKLLTDFIAHIFQRVTEYPNKFFGLLCSI